MNDDAPDGGMVKQQITLPDGRYLIYYTFEAAEISDGPSAAASSHV